jgi:class 3 adenylate cyclase
VAVWLYASPGSNQVAALPREHFFIVTLISLLAALVSILIARTALRMAQYQVLFVTLGFASLAGLFTVHALATPGILLREPDLALYGSPPGAPAAGASDPYGYGDYRLAGGHAMEIGGTPLDYSGTVVGISAYLSLFVPSLLFAGSTAPAVLGIARRLPLHTRGLAALVIGGVILYAVAALSMPGAVGGLLLASRPGVYALAAVTVVLLLTAAWRQLQSYLSTDLPTQGALALSFLLLAEAQLVMTFAAFWTISWWGYHLLMFGAVVLALGSLFIELDRRRGLERYVPRELVERVVTGNVLRREGERRVATILFADLRDSTRLAEELPSTAVVELLNTYVGALARCVFAGGGMLDKFLGDGLMAIFGVSPEPDRSDGAVPAAQAALDMRRAIAEVNARRGMAGGAPVEFGVAIHTGEVVLGEIGIPQRSDFTAVGDTVNTAARMGELAKSFGVDIILSGETVDRLAGTPLQVAALGETPIRGRRETVCAFTIR